MTLPDEVKQEISRQMKEWMWILLGTHVTAFVTGGGIGFVFGKMYESLKK